jgi:hypothetical protein
MERGHMRCDANVSIRPVGSDILNTKTEIKNVNSIDAIQSAIANEIKRQMREVAAGNKIEPWTLDWDDNAGVLRMMRSKETEADYRYFREPDLLSVNLDAAWKQEILADMPELPLQRRQRFTEQYGLPEYDADILTSERNLSDYFELAVNAYGGDAKRVSNWLMNDVHAPAERYRAGGRSDLKVTPGIWRRSSNWSTPIRSTPQPGKHCLRKSSQPVSRQRDRRSRKTWAGQRYRADPGDLRADRGREPGAAPKSTAAGKDN